MTFGVTSKRKVHAGLVRFGEDQASEPVAAGEWEVKRGFTVRLWARRRAGGVKWICPCEGCDCLANQPHNGVVNSVRFGGRDSVDSGETVKPTLAFFHGPCKGYTTSGAFAFDR